MKFKIRWRLDWSDFHETDDTTIEVRDWHDIIKEIESIEAGCATVLSVERLDSW